MKKPTPQLQSITSKPPPIGGLNARDAIAAMPELDAVNLVNWVPDTYGVRSRKGFSEWAINFPSDKAVEAIMSYISATTVIPSGAFLTAPTAMPGFLFAATNDGIYDVTSATDAPVLSQALSGADFAGWFSSETLANSAGTFLLACSEADGYFTFDGAAWLKRVAGAGPTEINGVDPADLVQVQIFKRRAWFVERDTTSAWYLPADAVAGTATEFNFGPQFRNGGSLAFLATWTIDAGDGVDDFLVAVSSMGDVAVYKGTDPASSTTFGIVGTWNVGQIPVGRRAWTQYGGDLIIASADGLYPISYVTRGGAEFLQASSKEYTSKIRTPIGADLRATFTIRGWDIVVHPGERLMCVSVPNYSGRNSFQHAMSTSLNQWCSFSGIPTYCYGKSAGYVFAGTEDGRVLLVFNGYFDDVAYGASVGNGISGIIVPAFTNLDKPGLEKQVHMVRPTFQAVDQPGFLIGVSVNYELESPTGSPSFVTPTTSLWDVALWDLGVWGGAQQVFSEWLGVEALGFAVSAAMVTEVVGDTTLVAIDYMWEPGGPL